MGSCGEEVVAEEVLDKLEALEDLVEEPCVSQQGYLTKFPAKPFHVSYAHWSLKLPK